MPLFPPYPAATTSGAGVIQLDGTASDIQPPGAAAAGASGLAADAKHVHPAQPVYFAARSTSVIAATIPFTSISTSTATVTSGTLYIARLNLAAGQVVTNVTFLTGTTGATTLSHGWAAILNTSYLQLAHSADVTSGNLSASTFISWALTSPWTVPSTGQYWAGYTIVASVQPTATSGNSQASAGYNALPLAGPSSTGLSGPGTDGSTSYVGPTTASGTFYIDVD